MTMTEVRFWELVDESRQGSEDQDAQEENLKKLLGKLSIDELVGFQTHFESFVHKAYRWDLWAAAYIINGGSSDDGFEYFRRWLVSRGEKIYSAVLADPNVLCEYASHDPELNEFETLGYCASEVYEERTGKDDLLDLVPALPGGNAASPVGEPWSEENVTELFPKLADKFWD